MMLVYADPPSRLVTAKVVLKTLFMLDIKLLLTPPESYIIINLYLANILRNRDVLNYKYFNPMRAKNLREISRSITSITVR